jgi:hypothetical protein
MGLSSINREDRLAYIDFFKGARDLAISSPFHILLFDEASSPVLQAITLSEILELHPTDAPFNTRLWSCEDVGEIFRVKQYLWVKGQGIEAHHSPPGTVMLIVPPLDEKGQRQAGLWETVHYWGEG